MEASDPEQIPETPPSVPQAHDHDKPVPTDVGRDADVTEDAHDTCRICRGEGSTAQPLFYPCKCSGSIRYVHQECLMEWLSHSKKKYCELCKTSFHFTKLYDQSMPATLPLLVFFRQVILHTLSGLIRWARYLTVAMIWLVALPWCIRQVWRGLFWLADGSWVPETQRRLQQLKETDGNVNGTSIANAVDGVLGSTTTETAAPQSLFRSTMHYLSGDSISAKVLRILFSIPPVQLGSSSSDGSVRKARSGPPQRPPSLLSDISLVKSWTTSTLAHNVTVDVLEGILISLALVATFILIFLIREWVINQQPLLNNNDQENADNPALGIDELRAQRALRRARRRGGNVADAPNLADINPANTEDALAEPSQTSDQPLRERAMTDDNILATNHANSIEIDSSPQARSSSARPASRGETEYNLFPGSDAPQTGSTVDHVDDTQRFPDGAPPLEPDLSAKLDDDTPDSAGPRLIESPLEAETFFQPPDADELGSSSLPIPPPEHDRAPTVLGSGQTEANKIQVDPAPSASRVVPEVSATPREIHGDPNDSDVSSLVITSSSDEDSAAANGHMPVADADNLDPSVELEAIDETAPGTTEEVAATAQAPPSRLARMAHFFWYVEDVPNPDLHQDLPHEQHVHDAAEAAFAPAGNRAFAMLPEVPEAPHPAPAEIPAGLDINDQNAIEDAEDLEGVLELVGMEGPLINMLQNVVFSLLLISLTLSAAVWIPYIWGKIALILVANPVAVVVKAPVYLVTHAVDLAADVCFFVLGLCGLIVNMLAKTVKHVMEPFAPSYSNLLDVETFETLAINVTHHSGSRLEKALSEAMTIFSPDLPTFSMQSHRALMTFKSSVAEAFSLAIACVVDTWTWMSGSSSSPSIVDKASAQLSEAPTYVTNLAKAVPESLPSLLRPQLTPLTLDTSSEQQLLLVDWSTQDKIIAIMLGYTFFAVAGLLFMKITHMFMGLKKDEKVEGPIADRLREAGGVMKVIVIIGIEMLVFPLYCGLLLDLALLPLFQGATIHTRALFIYQAPFSGLFLHWFAGTSYMFHFALFVSMCRKILRKGVLYFIRDPDDPTFHPVRDVLERPVPTQLGKIMFSALVYGGLVIMCLGGVVWSISRVSSVLPIHWTGAEPQLAMPYDVVLFNFLLPILVKRMKPSEKIAVVYEWWFRTIAHGLRLSHFLFGEEREDEKRPILANGILSWKRKIDLEEKELREDGTYVRAPASDSCRIPKGKKAFIEVTAENKRMDGQTDHRHGLHGKHNEKFTKIWLPPYFKPRVAAFVVLLWVFAAGTGIACTIGPLVVGRRVVKQLSGSRGPVNDLYALTVGLHLLGALIATAVYAPSAYRWTKSKISNSFANVGKTVPQVLHSLQRISGLIYLVTMFGIVLPFTLSLVSELYIHIPIITYAMDRSDFTAKETNTADVPLLSSAAKLSNTGLKAPPTVYILQTWTLGLLYLRLVMRIAMNYPCRHSRHAAAIRMILREGVWKPDALLATRAIIVPMLLLCVVLVTAPIGCARLVIVAGKVTSTDDMVRIYRLSYPGSLGLILLLWGTWSLKNRLASWRMLVRDEVYLVGERLHNYASHAVESRDKGKGKARERSPLVVAEDRVPPNVAADGNLAGDW